MIHSMWPPAPMAGTCLALALLAGCAGEMDAHRAPEDAQQHQGAEELTAAQAAAQELPDQPWSPADAPPGAEGAITGAYESTELSPLYAPDVPPLQRREVLDSDLATAEVMLTPPMAQPREGVAKTAPLEMKMAPREPAAAVRAQPLVPAVRPMRVEMAEPRMAETPEMAPLVAGEPGLPERVGVAAPPVTETPPGEEIATAAGSAEPPPASENFYRVKVFYGTDRAGLSADLRNRREYLGWLKWAGLSLLGTVAIAVVNLGYRQSRSLKVLLVLAVLVTCGFGSGTAVSWLQSVPVEQRPVVAYGGERGELRLGTCDVSIPKIHQVGRLEAPKLIKIEFQADPEKHIKVLETLEFSEDRFYGLLQDRVLQSASQQAFVFIHGYNVSFEDAVRRTAQLAFDLNFDGAPICYSWPSQAEYLGYATDEQNVVWTEPHLEQFLLGIKRRTGAERIHLVAHSMGNRALTSVLRSMSRDMEDATPLFDQVVLTAPDVDADIFRRDLAPAIAKTARRVTLYASSNDEALAMSKQYHGGYPRAGESGENIVVLPEIDTIDVSAVDTSLVGHTYYGDNTSVLADMLDVIQYSRQPQERAWLRPQPFDDMRYWVFLTERIGQGPPGERR